MAARAPAFVPPVSGRNRVSVKQRAQTDEPTHASRNYLPRPVSSLSGLGEPTWNKLEFLSRTLSVSSIKSFTSFSEINTFEVRDALAYIFLVSALLGQMPALDE